MGGQRESYYGLPAAALHGGRPPVRHPSLYGESGGEKGQRSAGITRGKEAPGRPRLGHKTGFKIFP